MPAIAACTITDNFRFQNRYRNSIVKDYAMLACSRVVPLNVALSTIGRNGPCAVCRTVMKFAGHLHAVVPLPNAGRSAPSAALPRGLDLLGGATGSALAGGTIPHVEARIGSTA